MTYARWVVSEHIYCIASRTIPTSSSEAQAHYWLGRHYYLRWKCCWQDKSYGRKFCFLHERDFILTTRRQTWDHSPTAKLLCVFVRWSDIQAARGPSYAQLPGLFIRRLFIFSGFEPQQSLKSTQALDITETSSNGNTFGRYFWCTVVLVFPPHPW